MPAGGSGLSAPESAQTLAGGPNVCVCVVGEVSSKIKASTLLSPTQSINPINHSFFQKITYNILRFSFIVHRYTFLGTGAKGIICIQRCSRSSLQSLRRGFRGTRFIEGKVSGEEERGKQDGAGEGLSKSPLSQMESDLDFTQ